MPPKKFPVNSHPVMYELDERVPVEKVKTLLRSEWLYDYIMGRSDGGGPPIVPQDWKVSSLAFLIEMFEKDGLARRSYSRSKKVASADDEQGDHRMYTTCGRGLQFTSRPIRGFLMSGVASDWDIENCHPMILLHKGMIPKRFPCPSMEDYCSNRDKWKKRYPDIKKLVISRINEDPAKRYDHKSKEVQVLLDEIQQFIKEEMVGIKIFDWLTKHENNLLGQVYTVLKMHQVTVLALIYDGLVTSNDTNATVAIAEANRLIAPFKIVLKPWELPVEPMKIIDTQKWDYSDPVIHDDILKLTGREYVSENHFYAEVLPLLLKTTRIIGDEVYCKSIRSPVHESFKVKKKIKRDDWKVSCKGPVHSKTIVIQDLFTKFGSLIRFPTATFVRNPKPHEFSLDTGFLCDHIPLPDDWEERLEPFKHHVFEVLANGNPEIEKGFYFFYANAIQSDEKSQVIMITIGKSRSGKSIIPQMIILYILGSKGYICEDFSKFLGQFNSLIMGRRMVLVNEMSNKDSQHRYTRIWKL